MLTSQQILRIRTKGISALHDYWFNSLFAGEPYLERDMLVYYDGRVVTICGFPFREELFDGEVCRSVARDWALNRRAEAIVFMGPRRVSLDCLRKEGFRRIAEGRPRRITEELFIDCSGAPRSALSTRVYRRSQARDFDLTLRQGGIVSAQHLQLLELFYRERELSEELAEVAFALPAVLRSRRIRLIEARRNKELCGFAAFHKPFAHTAVGLLMIVNPTVRGVSDFLYGKMLDQARLLGACDLNVGSSPSLGHFKFKLKWGGRPQVPSCYYAQWARGNIARRYHISWGPRLTRLKNYSP